MHTFLMRRHALCYTAGPAMSTDNTSPLLPTTAAGPSTDAAAGIAYRPVSSPPPAQRPRANSNKAKSSFARFLSFDALADHDKDPMEAPDSPGDHYEAVTVPAAADFRTT